MLIQRETCLGGKWHTFINYHILFLPRKLESHSKEQKLEANSKEKEEWKRINLPLEPSCKAGKNILVFGFNVACSREYALFVKGWYKAIVWSQSLLLTNAVAACCLDTSVYFCLRKLMLRSELKWLTWSSCSPCFWRAKILVNPATQMNTLLCGLETIHPRNIHVKKSVGKRVCDNMLWPSSSQMQIAVSVQSKVVTLCIVKTGLIIQHLI